MSDNATRPHAEIATELRECAPRLLPHYARLMREAATALSQPDSAPLAPVTGEQLKSIMDRTLADDLIGGTPPDWTEEAVKLNALLSHIDAGGKEDGTHTRPDRPSSEDVTGKWRPIETAPKDGTPILVYMPGGYQTTVVWHNGRWMMDVRSNWSYSPTYWMPLPEPPEMGAQPQSGGATP